MPKVKQIVDLVLSSIKQYRTLVNVTSSRNFANSDAGCFLTCNSSSAITLSIPGEGLGFTPNEPVEIMIARIGSGTVTIASTVLLVSLNGTVGGTYAIPARWNVVTLKRLSANSWIAYT